MPKESTNNKNSSLLIMGYPYLTEEVFHSHFSELSEISIYDLFDPRMNHLFNNHSFKSSTNEKIIQCSYKLSWIRDEREKGITTDIPFSFHSNWDSAGRWKIELYTCRRKIILCPLEELSIVMKNSINEEITKYDIGSLKHGLNNMLTSFLFNDKNNICSLGDQIASWNIYKIMNNEEKFNGNHI